MTRRALYKGMKITTNPYTIERHAMKMRALQAVVCHPTPLPSINVPIPIPEKREKREKTPRSIIIVNSESTLSFN